MRTTLSLQPVHGSYLEILKCFQEGRPLTAEQKNFLRRYHARISDKNFDQVLHYYKLLDNSLDMRRQEVTRDRLRKLKQHLSNSISTGTKQFKVQLTAKQFFQFRALSTPELIFFHGNQLLTGAPYFPGGVPHVDFLQWGNLFGIVKYEEVPGETATDANILIYFEEMADRKFEQCIEQVQYDNSSHQKIDDLQPAPGASPSFKL